MAELNDLDKKLKRKGFKSVKFRMDEYDSWFQYKPITNENQELDFSLGNELAGREHMGLVALAVNDETLDQFSDEARGLLIRLLNRVIR